MYLASQLRREGRRRAAGARRLGLRKVRLYRRVTLPRLPAARLASTGAARTLLGLRSLPGELRRKDDDDVATGGETSTGEEGKKYERKRIRVERGSLRRWKTKEREGTR